MARDIVDLVTEALTENGGDGSPQIDRDQLKTALKQALAGELALPISKRVPKRAMELDDEIISVLGKSFRQPQSRLAMKDWSAANSGRLGPANRERFIARMRVAVMYTPKDLWAARKGRPAWNEDTLQAFLDQCLLVSLPANREELDGNPE